MSELTARNDAIRQAYAKADTDWKRAATEVALHVAKDNPDGFISDAVWEILDAMAAKTHEARALGGIFKRLAGLGLIENSGQYRASDRKGCHRNMVSVWMPTDRLLAEAVAA